MPQATAQKIPLMKYLILLLGGFCWLTPAGATGDSLRYLTHQDTIFLSQGPMGDKIFNHILEPKQTLFSLAEFYGLDLRELYYYNQGLSAGGGPKPGMSIQVPIPNRAIVRYWMPGFRPHDYVPVYYQVQPGETLYRICKYHFKMPIDTIMNRNRLPNADLRRGQLLHVGWMSVYGIPEYMRQGGGGPMWQKSYSLEKAFKQESAGKKILDDQGIAHWPKEEKLQTGGGLYALHNEAPLNSVISITNPMTNRTVFVRVIERIPTIYDAKVKVMVSPAVAHMLGAIDPNFFVQIQYHDK
jgi:hypothetical protein